MNKIVKTYNEIEGFHYWENAYNKVYFLRNNHRHIFHIICYFSVTDSDREIEFIDKSWHIQQLIKNRYGMPASFGQMSCEHIAEFLIKELNCIACEVNEDGQGGAILYTEKWKI